MAFKKAFEYRTKGLNGYSRGSFGLYETYTLYLPNANLNHKLCEQLFLFLLLRRMLITIPNYAKCFTILFVLYNSVLVLLVL